MFFHNHYLQDKRRYVANLSECVLKYKLCTAFSITLTKNRQNNFVLNLFIKNLKKTLEFGYWLNSSLN
ncbi:hypothetical protein AO384_0984 [Moraxella catarrhalis]|uniref:Uncharacterized protein n=1 Tax=Moraxella catarrhalis TaxID=480 RepID=A0A198UIT0_MORCA|nr:hypothetical protein AO384_0984 [Moraxella catarrhalis]OAU97254.1 hypothetical protein AO383_1135 [Moraxella catarrhalis]